MDLISITTLNIIRMNKINKVQSLKIKYFKRKISETIMRRFSQNKIMEAIKKRINIRLESRAYLIEDFKIRNYNLLVIKTHYNSLRLLRLKKLETLTNSLTS